jgi:hypothetical protein
MRSTSARRSTSSSTIPTCPSATIPPSRRCAASRPDERTTYSSAASGAATFYSLIGACRALELNPYAYLRETTETLLRSPDTPRAELTPWAWAAARRAREMATTTSSSSTAVAPPAAPAT